MPTTPAEDLTEMAVDELARALTLSWGSLSGVTPWGDSFDGVTAAGREVTVERSYLWLSEEGGDILCEVNVFTGETRWDEGARLSSVIARDSR